MCFTFFEVVEPHNKLNKQYILQLRTFPQKKFSDTGVHRCTPVYTGVRLLVIYAPDTGVHRCTPVSEFFKRKSAQTADYTSE